MSAAPDRAALAAHLFSRFRAFPASKGDVPYVAEAARIFDVARLFGAGVPSADEFLDRYWTTIGPVIFRPRNRAHDPAADLRVILHEVGHVVQFWRDPGALVARYLDRRGRAEMEAEAERAAMEGMWLVTGELPRDLGEIDVCRHGYDLGDAPGEHDDFADLTRNLLEQASTSVAAGVMSTDVGIACRAWLRAHGGSR